ncbi:L-aspartate oxidase [Methylophaga sp.]|uniref:L-aspartate oxidase n=1 Tax=Methylophaga sp. TaxID=2024840 RepID=UPI00175D991A|nr:L-aspartate oxidase [Methylophaga sp.]HIC47110.1 L-aspartate oxidase [Methylophaga sp.]
MTTTHHYDILIIGSGTAGLTLALHMADDVKVAVISKGQLEEGASLYAQGGISVVLDKTDSIQSHIDDTLRAGAGLCSEKAVRFTVEHARENIEWLIKQGVTFTRDGITSETYHLTQEGGHSHRRIIHSADATGREVETTLLDKAKAHPNIELLPYHIGIDLISSNKQLGEKENRILGCYVLDIKKDEAKTLLAPITVLATGGAGKVYLYTSNPDVSTGDGIAMGWRAGCRIANMEFIQFHPTFLFHPQAKSFLISEALRGEGAKLVLANGERFMERFHPQAELAPRDVVARAIDHEMKRTGHDCVYLDISHKPAAFIKEHFPTIYRRCLQFGIDITKQAIPVVPAAHYTCGGIMTDLNGKTDVPGLYAIGETAHTGLHGANRMASNSLLECLVFAKSAADDIKKQLPLTTSAIVPQWDASQVYPAKEAVAISHNWDELRRVMWNYVGIVRKTDRLLRARQRLQVLQAEIRDYYSKHHISADLLELRNLADVAELIIESALRRKESRGLHYILDYPETDNSQPATETIILPKHQDHEAVP